MVEKLVAFILSLFSNVTSIPFGKELIVFIISLMPILELRGGLLAASLLNLNPIVSYVIAVIGNIIPIPFILWFINSILDWMRKRKKLNKIVKWLDKKIIKHKSVKLNPTLKKRKQLKCHLHLGRVRWSMNLS